MQSIIESHLNTWINNGVFENIKKKDAEQESASEASKDKGAEKKPKAPKHKDAITQNKPPQIPWSSFEQCWSATVKNGTPFLMEACKAHIKAMGWLNSPEKWISGMKHFGIEVEK